MQIGLHRFLGGGIALREHRDQLAVGNRIVDEPDRTLARDRQGHERIRKQDRVAQGQDRQLGRNRQWPIGSSQFLGIEILDLIAHVELLVCDWAAALVMSAALGPTIRGRRL